MSIAVWSMIYMFFFSVSGCLALAELGRRGLLLPDRLPEGLSTSYFSLPHDFVSKQRCSENKAGILF